MGKRKEVWTPEKAQRRRERLGWSPVDNRETKIPDEIYEAGRELTKMMRLSTSEFWERYLKEK